LELKQREEHQVPDDEETASPQIDRKKRHFVGVPVSIKKKKKSSNKSDED
jgi:hypothetical protein